MMVPEDWQFETADNARHELSYVLSLFMPASLTALMLLAPWVEEMLLPALVAVGVVVILVGTPLALVGYWTSNYRMRRKTVPFTVLALTVSACMLAHLL